MAMNQSVNVPGPVELSTRCVVVGSWSGLLISGSKVQVLAAGSRSQNERRLLIPWPPGLGFSPS